MPDDRVAYGTDELYEDLHHLLQPVIGMLRLYKNDGDNLIHHAKYMEERLLCPCPLLISLWLKVKRLEPQTSIECAI